jgi:hypothetical protein
MNYLNKIVRTDVLKWIRGNVTPKESGLHIAMFYCYTRTEPVLKLAYYNAIKNRWYFDPHDAQEIPYTEIVMYARIETPPDSGHWFQRQHNETGANLLHSFIGRGLVTLYNEELDEVNL